ncbi:MAG: YicC family protein [Eubacterium sp.]|nr:YicC family protein [Eubacterium sp.]
MIKSMTGFGHCEVTENQRKITVEMKSVNHRYLDLNIKMPKKLNFFEAAIRNFMKDYIQRGKVDVYVSYEDMSEDTMLVKYNSAIAAEYLKQLTAMAEEFNLENDIRVGALSRYPEVLTMEEQSMDEEELWSLLEKALKGACEQFVETRVREGQNLYNDLMDKLTHLEENVAKVEERSPEILAEYRQKLYDKVSELLGDKQIDEGRIATELVIFADKICTDEETVRLKSHIQTTKKTLNETESIGRKLDFIAQEMNREANTILSKANDLTVSNIAIDLKTEIEKVREQIQNIE